MVVEKRLEWIATFELWDRQKNGALPLEDVIILIKCLGCVPTVKELTSISRQYGNGPIPLEQFLVIMAKIEAEEQLKSDVQHAFKVLDCDENGFMNQQVLKNKLTTLGRKPFTEKEYETFIADTPATKQGEIDLILLSRTIMAKTIN